MTWPESIVSIAWTLVGADNLRRTLAARARGGDGGFPAPAAAMFVLGGLLAAWWSLEQMTDRWNPPPTADYAGIAAAVAGAVLHVLARHTLGMAWATHIQPRTTLSPITAGPYAAIRHPLYAAVRLLAVAVPLVHPSPATLCFAGGLVVGTELKARAEERALAAAFPAAYAAYAGVTPRFFPRFHTRR